MSDDSPKKPDSPDEEEPLSAEAADFLVDPIDTDYEIGQDNKTKRFGNIRVDFHSPVFQVSSLTIIAFVVLTLIFREQANAFFPKVREGITSSFAWFFLSTANLLVIFCLALIVSPWGKIRLGGPEATPDFSYRGWFAMLFAAGMGIGLMFYGVAEPIEHYQASFDGAQIGEDGVRTDWAPLDGAAGDVAGARSLGMAATIFHWGLHPWAIYAVLALALGLFSYNKGLPLTIRSTFYPLLGDRVWGWPGNVIDIVATLFGLATSLGIGAAQANSGLNELFGMPVGESAQTYLIIGITLMALISVVRGLEGGIKVLSEVNMGFALLLLLFVFFLGPTAELLSGFVDSLTSYGRYLPALSMPFAREDANFTQGWTSFYWAWWISWSPFVGMFIARVSRGRTVREFMICVLLIPSLVSVFWMSTFGGTAIKQMLGNETEVAGADLAVKLFTMLEGLPWTGVTSLVGIILVIVFFVTSSDSGSLVIDTITAGGKLEAPVFQRIFWASFEGVTAIVLLLGGGLVALQAMVLTTGLPFALVLLVLCVSIAKGLQSEHVATKAFIEDEGSGI
jgi:BCCT family betaine/carnitine transporter